MQDSSDQDRRGKKRKNVDIIFCQDVSKNSLGEAFQKDSLGDAFQKEVRPFIEVIDNLRKNGLQNDIQLPNVVVVGDQSSGKSSIIEAISGIQLPRGRGIVTRCPLELQLKKMRNNVKWKGTLIIGKKEIDITNPEDVERLISEAQNEICGNDKNISEEILTLRIESNASNAAELTLIDLPGIARTAVEGQRKDVCTRIKDIIKNFIKNENTVILCMVSANLDVAVNESLNLAKEFDPDSERTLGVISKPDLAEDHQKEAMLKLLNNETFILKKGYRMVKCRSHEQLKNNTSLNEALTTEMEFFKNDKFYSTADPSLLGTMNLANKITKELVTVIQKTIPTLKSDVKKELEVTKNELDKLPPALPESDAEKNVYLNTTFHHMLNEINNLLTKGNYEDNNVFRIWRKQFQKFQQSITNLQENAFSYEFQASRLSVKIESERGREMSGFLNYDVFEKLSSDHVQLYNPEAKVLLNEMTKTTEEALLEISKRFLKHLPAVQKDVEGILEKSLEGFMASAKENLDFIFEVEKNIFSTDSVFEAELENIRTRKEGSLLNTTKSTTFGSASQTFSFANTNEIQKRLKDNSDIMEKLLRCYLKIVLNRLCDNIFMTIRQWIHFRLNDSLKESFLKYSSESNNEGKVIENEISKRKRTRLSEKLQRLQLAKEKLYNF